MIIWIAGQSKSGKTTLAKQLHEKIKGSVWLDGDSMRQSINRDLGLGEKARIENNMRIARLAKEMENQGHDVIVSTICPYRKLRFDIKRITDCQFILLRGGMEHPDYPFEYGDYEDTKMQSEHDGNVEVDTYGEARKKK